MKADVHVRPFEADDHDQVVALWEQVFPDDPKHNNPAALIRRKLTIQPHLFFVAVRQGQVCGTVMAGYDGVRGWIHKMATSPDVRGLGVGRALMDAAERGLENLGCVKVNLQVRAGNVAAEFYRTIGYTEEDRLSFGKPLSADELPPPQIRAQYHFRKSSKGLLAWDVRKLVARAQSMNATTVDVQSLPDIDENYWFEGKVPTPRHLVEHWRLVQSADLSHPVILCSQGRLMDGMHRVCKALFQGIDRLPCVQFEQDPEPDYVGIQPEDLPYDELST